MAEKSKADDLQEAAGSIRAQLGDLDREIETQLSLLQASPDRPQDSPVDRAMAELEYARDRVKGTIESMDSPGPSYSAEWQRQRLDSLRGNVANATPHLKAAGAEFTPALQKFVSQSAPDTRSTAQVLADAREHNAKQKAAETKREDTDGPASKPSTKADVESDTPDDSATALDPRIPLEQLPEVAAVLPPPTESIAGPIKQEPDVAEHAITNQRPSLVPAAAPSPPASTSKPAAFTPTIDWQDIPPGATLPPGLQIQMNVATGRNQARRPPPQEPPDPAQQTASSATPQQPAPASPAAQPVAAPPAHPSQSDATPPAQPQVAPATPPAVPVTTEAAASRPADAAAATSSQAAPQPPPQGQQTPAVLPVTNAGSGRGAQPPTTPPSAAAPAAPEPDPSRSPAPSPESQTDNEPLPTPATPPPERDTTRPEQGPAEPQTQTGTNRGGGTPEPPVAAEPIPTWRQNYDRRRDDGQGRVRAAAGATWDSVEDRVIDWQLDREDTARRTAPERAAAVDREAQQAGGTTSPQHPLVEAAGRALAGDQDLAKQNRQQFMAAQATEEGLPPTLQSPEAYYAASKLGYRPGDRLAPSAAGRRDRSDDPGLQWRDLGDVGERERLVAAETLEQTRAEIRDDQEIPPDREALAQALRRNENLTAADAYVIQQRQEHGTDPRVVPPPRKSSALERMLGIKDDDEDKDGLRTAKMVGAVEYGKHAIRQYAAAGSEGARPFVGDAPAAIAGSAGQAMAGVVGGAGTVAAGVATANPLLVAKGMADLGAEVVKLPGMLVQWGDALISSADNIKQFSSVLANAFAVAELRTMQRQFGSAQHTADASANLIDAREDFSDSVQPLKDLGTNVLSQDIANGIRKLTEITDMMRQWGQAIGIFKSDEDLAKEQTPFQETVEGIKAGGFAAQNEKGEWEQHDLEGQFGGQGMAGDPAGGQRPGQGFASGAGRAGLPPWRRAPGGDEPERDGAAPATPRGVGQGVADARRAQDRQAIKDRYERERAELAKIDKPTAEQNAAAKAMDDAFSAQEAKWREQDESRKAKEIEAFRRAGQGNAPRQGGKPGRAPGAPELPDDTPGSPFPGMPGPMRDNSGRQFPQVHAAPESKPAGGHSFAWDAVTAIPNAMLGNDPGSNAIRSLMGLFRIASSARATMEDTRPPSQTAGNVP